MKKTASSTILFVLLTASFAAVGSAAGGTANFDNLTLAPNSYWNGPDPNGTVEDDQVNGGSMVVGSFTSGGAQFVNWHNTTYESWTGFAYSNTTNTTTPGYSNQYSAITGRGHDSTTGPSDNYAVAYGYLDQPPTNYAQLQTLPYFDVPSGQHATSMVVTNTTYAYLSMKNGDQFSKKFGGPSGNDPDYFKLSVYGTNASNVQLGTQVDFYLADYRFANNAQDYIVNQWTQVDLSALSGATRLYFNLSSTDVGVFGMNTPSFFALDDVGFSPNRTLGDFNLDGHVDAQDIKAMEAALANLQGYQYGSNAQATTLTDADLLQIGDLNGDNKINGADLQKLLNVLKSGGGSTSVPEPATFSLLAIAALTFLGGFCQDKRLRSS